MVKLSSYIVFTSLLLISILLFYTSKVALDNHIFRETDILNPYLSRDRHWHLIRKVSHPPAFTNLTTTISNVDIQRPSIQVKVSCQLHFPPQCVIYPNLIKYWEENTHDCFKSPLRATSGLQVKRVEDRRYLVFQTDLGGWNNIRMGK